MSDEPKKPSDRPRIDLVTPPKTRSGEYAAVKNFRAKLDSLAEGTYGQMNDLNTQLTDFVEQLRGNSLRPPAPPPEEPEHPPIGSSRPPPLMRVVENLEPSLDDIVGWNDETDEPIRRRDLARMTPRR